MAGSGHPPASAAGSDLSSRREEGQGRRASGRRGGDSRADTLVGTAERTSVAAAGDDRANRRRLSYRTDECRSPSRAPGGVLPAGHGWPAAGRGSRTRTPAGGAHPPVRATGSVDYNGAPDPPCMGSIGGARSPAWKRVLHACDRARLAAIRVDRAHPGAQSSRSTPCIGGGGRSPRVRGLAPVIAAIASSSSNGTQPSVRKNHAPWRSLPLPSWYSSSPK